MVNRILCEARGKRNILTLVSVVSVGVTWSKRKLSERLIDRMKELLPSYDKVTFDSIEYLEEEKMAIGKIQKIVKKLQAEEII